MASPILRLNNLTGSDAAASGAGPATALTGAGASTDGTGLVVTLAGDLSGVLTDGRHVLWLNTGSGRQYSAIVGKAGVTVTVETAYGGSLSGLTWAIGGKRATLDHAGTRTLFADALPGWVIDLEDTGNPYYLLAGPLAITASGGAAGPITLKSSNVTRPIINASAAGMNLLEPAAAAGWVLEHLELRHTGSPPGDGLHAKTNLCLGWVVRDCLIQGCKIGINGDFIIDYSFQLLLLEQTEIRNCTSHAVSNAYGTLVEACYIHDNAGDGFNAGSAGDPTNRFHLGASYTIFARNARNVATNASGALRSISLRHCVLDGAASHGIDLGGAGQRVVMLVNNIIYGSGGWGVTADAPPLALMNRRNAYGANTSGARNNVADAPFIPNRGDLRDIPLSADPFVDRAGHDYTPNETPGGGQDLRFQAAPGWWPAGLVMEPGSPDVGAMQLYTASVVDDNVHPIFGSDIVT